MGNYLAEAHAQWHTVHGWDAVCPLDCGANEAAMAIHEEESSPLVRCGYCGWLETIAGVRECAERHYGRRLEA